MQPSFRTILVATDFDEPSQRALEYAQEMTDRLGAGLRVLHVVQIPRLLGTELEPPDVPFNTEKALQDAQSRLAETLRQVAVGDVIGQVLVGHAADKIVEYAREHNVDLIVMGTHGRRALARFIESSVAERVVRTAPCPVLTVRGMEAPRSTAHEDQYAAAS